MRLKLPPKTTIKLHTHPAGENVTILSGTLYFAASDKFDPKLAKAFGPGSYFSIGQGKPMFAYSATSKKNPSFIFAPAFRFALLICGRALAR